MSGIIAVHDILIMSGLIAVGAWLESIGKKSDWLDELLTPFPLGLLGLVIVVAERINI